MDISVKQSVRAEIAIEDGLRYTGIEMSLRQRQILREKLANWIKSGHALRLKIKKGKQALTVKLPSPVKKIA